MKTTISVSLEITTAGKIRQLQMDLSVKKNGAKVTMDTLLNTLIDAYESDKKDEKEHENAT